MTLIVLGAILCALVVIARELRLLRQQRSGPQKALSTLRDRARELRFADMNTSAIAIFAAVAIWFKVMFPQLPMEPWVRYPITLIGVFVLTFVVDVAIFISVNPVLTWMDKLKDKFF